LLFKKFKKKIYIFLKNQNVLSNALVVIITNVRIVMVKIEIRQIFVSVTIILLNLFLIIMNKELGIAKIVSKVMKNKNNWMNFFVF
jgi:hypothetical protein